MPIIDSLEKYKGNTFMMELSDGETVFINFDTVMEFHLKAGMNVPDEAMGEIKHFDQLRKARERALYLLDYRDYCFIELYKKLEANYEESVCLEVLRWLCDCGLVDDRRYANRLGEKLIVSKGFGYYRAKQEMLMKGLDRELVEEVLSQYEEDTLSRLEELVEKKYAHKIVDKKSLARVKNALVRQGYTYSDVNSVLSGYEFDEEYYD